MRPLRSIACIALGASSSACTIWYLVADPYGGDAQALADAQLSDVVAPDAATLELLKTNVGSIAAYGSTLFANVDGALWSCSDASGCATLTQLVAVDASVLSPPGVAANDGGVYWVQGNGIWYAALDGAGAALVIRDANNPSVLALDGPRLSWTTQRDGGAIVDSCRVAKNGCLFNGSGVGDGGVSSGAGGPSQLVPSTANLDNTKLAAAPGYVLWVLDTSNSQTITFTPVDAGASFTLVPANDSVFKKDSDKTLVANDDQHAYFSFFHKSDTTYVVEQAALPPSTSNVGVTPGTISGNHSYCLGAAGGVVAYATNVNQVSVVGVDGSAGESVTLGDAQAPASVAATSDWIFILDDFGSLYRFPRVK